MTDAELAAHLAETAGEMLLQLRATRGFSPSELGAAGDRIANRYLVDTLREQRPQDWILSEEERDNRERLARRRVWIVDPVDGTREYGAGRSDWAVHVGLAVGGTASVGAVALPGLDLVLRSDAPAALPPAPERPRMLVSRTRPPPQAERIAAELGAELIAMGSAGAKAMAIIRGEGDIYFHAGGQHEWDSCAPVAVAAAHGLHVSRADGSALVYNQADTLLPDLLICRPEWAQPVLAACGKV